MCGPSLSWSFHFGLKDWTGLDFQALLVCKVIYGQLVGGLIYISCEDS